MGEYTSGSDTIISELEQSLIQYLMDKKDVETKVTGGSRRLRSLSFKIITKKEPYFSVQIGMLEAVFSAVSGLKEKGSCYGIERYIRDWFLRPSVSDTIRNYVNKHKSDMN